MIDVSIQYLLYAPHWLFWSAWRAVPLFGIVLLIDVLLQRRIAPRFHCLLWMLVIVRLAFPVSVESPLSLQHVTSRIATATGALGGAAPQERAGDLDVQFNALPTAGAQSNALSTWRPDSSAGDQDDREAAIAVTVDEDAWLGLAYASIVGSWFTIAMILIARSTIAHVRFWRRIGQYDDITDQNLVDELLRVCDAAALGKRPRMKVIPELSAPAVFGIFRPVICLPQHATELSKRELRLILMHEVAHVRRRDGLLLSVASFVRAVQWVNPIAWIAVARLRTYIEQAADDAVMRQDNTKSAAEYGELLLRYAQNDTVCNVTPAVGLLFSWPGKTLSTRIQLLNRNDQRNHWAARLIAAAAVFLLATAGLTDAGHSKRAVHSDLPQLPHFGSEPVFTDQTIERPDPGPIVTRQYDLTAAIERIKEVNPDVDPETYLRALAEVPPPPTPGSMATKVTLENHTLSVTTAERHHDALQENLDLIARSGLWQVVFELRTIHAKLDIARQLGIVWETGTIRTAETNADIHDLLPSSESSDKLTIHSELSGQSRLPVAGVRVSKRLVNRFLDRCRGDARTNVMTSPKVTLFNGQRATISDEVQRPFVTGIQPSDDGLSVSPVVDVLTEGTRILLHSEVTAEEDLSLRCRLSQSEIVDVSLAKVPFGNGSTSTVQVPRALTDSTSITTTLQGDQALLIAVPTPFKPGKTTDPPMAKFYLLSKTLIRETDMTRPAPMTVKIPSPVEALRRIGKRN